jgi:acetyltransferase-like isoleucine patch superfamily enzyme
MEKFWMRYADLSFLGRIATRLAVWMAPPYYGRIYLSRRNRRGYISAQVVIDHPDLRLGANVFIDDRVVIIQKRQGGSVELGDRVCIYRDVIIETGPGGSLTVGSDSSIHPVPNKCFCVPIAIGSGVMIAASCALYSYDHGLLPDQPIRKQAVQSKGPIIIEDGAWLGYGTIVLGGVRIGKGAAIGAGSVVTRDIPDGAVAVGNPARVVKMRADMACDRGNVSV